MSCIRDRPVKSSTRWDAGPPTGGHELRACKALEFDDSVAPAVLNAGRVPAESPNPMLCSGHCLCVTSHVRIPWQARYMSITQRIAAETSSAQHHACPQLREPPPVDRLIILARVRGGTMTVPWIRGLGRQGEDRAKRCGWRHGPLGPGPKIPALSDRLSAIKRGGH